MALIEIKALSYRFADGTVGVQAINLSIAQGEFVIIAGANGSGKTTLCRHLNGLLQPSSGGVWLKNKLVTDHVKKARQMVGMVFQNADHQIVGETVRNDVAFGPENLCLKRDEINRRVTAALETVGLVELADRRPNTLSGGEKRKLALAGVLAMKPEILVLDEPFSNLDYPGTKQVLKQILAFHRANHTIIIVTHELDPVIAHADHLVIMADGRIVADGPPTDLLKSVERFGIREPFYSKVGMEIQPWLS